MAEDETNNQLDASRVSYRLRSTFFYRKLGEYRTLELPALIRGLLAVESLYIWDDRAAWNVGESAFAYVQGHAHLHLIEVFCHPKLLKEHARLLAYYRNIAVLSQKAVSYLARIDVKGIEADTENRITLRDDQTLTLARLFNEHTTLIVDSSLQTISYDELYGALLASTGAQIDGSWRNAIGEESEKVVQRLLVKEARKRDLLAALFPRVGTAAEIFNAGEGEEQLGAIERYRGVLLSNKTSILFASDPDISLVDEHGKTVGVIEVKGGVDPAGALERYGAAKKSFEAARRITSDVATLLVASGMTSEALARIQQDSLISAFYKLATLLDESMPAFSEFMRQVFSLLGA